MDLGRASFSYAHALLVWATDRGVGKEVYHQSHLLLKLLDESADLLLFLQSPMVKQSNKIRTVKEIMTKSAPLLTDFVTLIVKNGRVAQLNRIFMTFRKIFREKFGILNARVESSQKLEVAFEEKFLTFLENYFRKEIEIEFAINPSLIGGFILTVEDQMLDKSVRNELQTLQKNLMGIVQ